MSEHEVELTADENRLMTAALAADGGCWDYEQCCWVSFEALRPVVAGIIAARLADAEARAEAAEAKVARVADLAVKWDEIDLGTDRYCAQELREALRGDQ